jgi:hypothetical protein
MRAIVLEKFGGLDSSVYKNIPDPEPKAGHVVIQIIFGVAAVDCAAEAAHQRRHFRADWKLAARAGFHQANAFDTAHRRSLGPLAAPHVHLRWLSPNAFRDAPDRPQRVIHRRPAVRSHIAEQAVVPIIRATHPTPPRC